MSWGHLGADGLVSWKRGTHLGALLSQASAPLALEPVLPWPWNGGGVLLCPLPMGPGRWADSGELGWRPGTRTGDRGGDPEASLHQMPDAFLPNGSVLSGHCEGHGCGKPGRGGSMVRRPNKQALRRQAAN